MFITRCIFIWIVLLFGAKPCHAQIDSIARNLADTLISKLIVEDIPKKTFKEKLLYPHRWYVKRKLRTKTTDFDESYILSNKGKLTITLPVTRRFYGFNINDFIAEKKTLKFSPNNYYRVGVNFSNIIVTFGFAPIVQFGSKRDRGFTKSKDFQLTLIGRRVITDINLQNYKGFYVYNTNEYLTGSHMPNSFVVRPDIQVVSYGVNSMYIFNYKKYSLRGGFSFTDVQRKSAGSWMVGLFHSDLNLSSKDSTFLTYPFRNHFSPLLNRINKISVITIGPSGGYGYTLVLRKKIIISSVLNIGLGGQKLNYRTTDGKEHVLPLNLSAHINAKTSIRYDNLKFFTGLMAAYDNNFPFFSNQFNTQSYIGKIVFFTGYRFDVKKGSRKILKKMGLIDYNK